MRLCRFTIMVALIATAEVGQTLPAQETCDIAALRAAEVVGVPAQLMLAIARVETGRQIDGKVAPWPWTVNLEGQGHWFENAIDAASFVQSAINAGQSNLDIGCFQLNLRWHAKGFDNLDTMFDPVENAHYAAVYLKRLHAEKGNWVDAAAAYHSATPEHAKSYVEKLEAVLASLPSLVDAAPSQVSNSFPLLQSGEPRGLASLVPQVVFANRLISTGP